MRYETIVSWTLPKKTRVVFETISDKKLDPLWRFGRQRKADSEEDEPSEINIRADETRGQAQFLQDGRRNAWKGIDIGCVGIWPE